jgi:hypothetical protein
MDLRPFRSAGVDDHVQVGAFTPDDWQERLVGGGRDDLDEPISAALGGGAGVGGVGGDQERLQCGGQQRS